MGYLEILKYIYYKKISIGVQILLTFFTYLLVKYRYRHTSSYVPLKKRTKKRLIKAFKPDPIVQSVKEPYIFNNVKYNFSSYDVFNLAKKYKEEIKSVIREYGVGTCGPRGFYGTLDIHLDLEKKLAEIFDREAAMIYPNYFACIQSVIPCFCKSRNNVFVYSKASEAIKSGITLCRSTIHTYDSMDDLKKKLDRKMKYKFVIVERVAKNTGEVADLDLLVRWKNEYGFRMILDEGYSIPYLYQKPANPEVYQDIDLMMGSLCLGYPTNGGFCVGSKEAIEYQVLSGTGYVFSASLPAFLCKAAMCMIEDKIDYTKIRRKIEIAHKHIPGIVTGVDTPVMLIKCSDVEEKYNKIRDEGYVIGRCGDYIRMCLNEEAREEDIKRIGEILSIN